MHVAGYRREDIDAAKPISTAQQPTRHARIWIFSAMTRSPKKDLVSKQQRDTAEANWKISLARKKTRDTSWTAAARLPPGRNCDGASAIPAGASGRWRKCARQSAGRCAGHERGTRVRRSALFVNGKCWRRRRQRLRCSMFARVISSRPTHRRDVARERSDLRPHLRSGNGADRVSSARKRKFTSTRFKSNPSMASSSRSIRGDFFHARTDTRGARSPGFGVKFVLMIPRPRPARNVADVRLLP